MNVPALLFEESILALGGRVVLRALNLSIPQGVFVGVLGPNGAGKTTFLRAALGLVRPASGRISVLGQPAGRGRAAIGYLPQTRTPLSDIALSGRDFVAVASGGGGWGLAWPDKAQRADVARVIELVDAGAFADRPLRTLSGGERQRLLLAQALLGEPKLLLLDEPLSSLDPPHQSATIALVHALQKRLGITVLMTAHELNPLLPVLDRVLYLGHGEAALGSVAEVVTAETLSRLYGAPIDVLRVQGRIFVMADGHIMEQDSHVHL
jgi:zinc/manganese transport system ATP-binding protein